jgi:pilus assembly protein Flp/PilA
MLKQLTRFAKDDQGAAMVEYGLLVGLIAVVCIVGIHQLGTNVNDVF